jgi:hypothetical protein
VLAYWILELTYDWAKSKRKLIDEWTISRRILSAGSMHLAAIVYQLVVRDAVGTSTEDLIHKIKQDPKQMQSHLEAALSLLVDLLESNPAFKEDVDLALKSQVLDEAIHNKLSPKTIEQLALAF